jgi:hypothetical protein
MAWLLSSESKTDRNEKAAYIIQERAIHVDAWWVNFFAKKHGRSMAQFGSKGAPPMRMEELFK